MNLPRVSLEPLFQRVTELSRKQRILICVAAFAVPVLLWGYLAAFPRYTAIQELSGELEQLEQEIQTTTLLARQINRYQKEMAEVEEAFLKARSALPDKEEIPSLLTGITRSGHTVGLEFFLFEPKAEIRKDFYAELPVSITVSGDYHQVAMFFDHVSTLSRIVNIRDIKMTPQKDSPRLTTNCTAVTFKFVEEKPPADPENKKGKKSGGAK